LIITNYKYGIVEVTSAIAKATNYWCKQY